MHLSTLPIELLTRREMRKLTTLLEPLGQSFLRARRAEGVSARTLDLYALQLRQFAQWLRADGRTGTLEDLEPEVVRAYIEFQQTRGFSHPSPHQARNAAVALRSLGAWLAREGIRSEDGGSVLARVRIPRVDDDDARRPLSDVELARVLAATREGPNGPRDFAILTLLATTGIRFGELLAVRLGDIDLDERQLEIRAATSKSRRARSVDLYPEAIAALDRYLADGRAGPTVPDAPLFTTRSGTAFRRWGLRQVFRRLRTRTGIAHFSAHILRHTWTRNYRRAGTGDLEDLRQQGGWTPESFARMLRRYAHERPIEERRRAPSPLSVLTRQQDDKWSPPTRSGLRRAVQRSRIATKTA